MRKLKQNEFLSAYNSLLVDYRSPSNINYAWNLGSLAGLCLVIQLISGIFLAMHYTAHVDLAFISVEHIMRNVNQGWLIRYIHSNGASMFFIVIYMHIFRGIYYSSYTKPRIITWSIGVIIFLLLMGTAFVGYVLPWGQMSFWGATVITNLISAIPIVGKDIVEWIWGGFSIGNPTLNRFFSFHYLLPFIIAALSGAHLISLHQVHSNNNLGLYGYGEKIPFHQYFTSKDLHGIVIFSFVLILLVFFYPNLLAHPDNYIVANPMVTPTHIVPEWYFLPYYAILRSIPNKLAGVIAMICSILILLILPFLHLPYSRSCLFKIYQKKLNWVFLLNVFLLGYIGQSVIEPPYFIIGQIASITYFMYFLIFTPFCSWIENKLCQWN